MKCRFKFLIEKGFPLIALLGGIAFSIRSCYITHVNSKEGLPSQYVDVTGNMEYTEFKDGSEEIKFTGYTSDKTYITLCHNFDRDDTIDQMKSYEKTESSLNLEQVLERKKDFEANRHLFETADKLLLKFRKKN